MAGPRRNAPTEEATEQTETPAVETPAELSELDIEEVGFEAAGGRELHPQIVAAIQKSWQNRVVKGNRIDTPTSRLVCRSEAEVKLRTRQIRDAAAHLNIGVGIKGPEQSNGTYVLRFRARKRRGSADMAA